MLSSEPDDMKSIACPTFASLRLVFLCLPGYLPMAIAATIASSESSEGHCVGAISPQPRLSLYLASTGSSRLLLTVDPCDDALDLNVWAWYDGSCPLYDEAIEDSSSMHKFGAGRFVKPSLSGSASPLGNDAAGFSERSRDSSICFWLALAFSNKLCNIGERINAAALLRVSL